ncbi:hypothetical protein BB560_000625 [Smittium megazygosporum]|uniref:Acyl-coenzyme A oxidase n=1 Tax=Smittium megazygosporum TaxID=133381 RepID=A0A2T9ZJW2_9FUNG|nr:hypothetical protein BB560_000625 [Smittium megazygosporum]
MSITAKTIQAERGKSFFDINDMDTFMNGSEYIQRRQKSLKIIKSEKIFDQKDVYFMSRTEKIEKGLMQEKRVVELLREGKIEPKDVSVIFDILDWSAAFELTRAAFIPTLEQQCNDDQRVAFLEPALRYEIIGCYAQTELGHGSNVRGLETTATYIADTDELEINSPSLTSTKWWIGTLGVVATHACIMAQLYVEGRHIGLFPVVIPIRSSDDHKPLPGITVGDIGPKMGFNAVDNGFINFNKVRVPRFNLLQKFITLSKGGEVSRPKNINPRATYGTMVYIRANIIRNMGRQLTKGITIAIRYTAIRRQFGEPGQLEKPVLDYDIVQYRLIPLLAKTYALIGMSHEFTAEYEKTAALVKQGDFSKLKEMHAVSCGLKRWTSNVAIYGVDTCRHVCGGHGYSMFSGLNEFFANIYPNIIWEGDNFVLAKQTAMYLVKSAHALMNRESVEPNSTTNMIRKFLNFDNMIPTHDLFTWSTKSGEEISMDNNILLDVLGFKVISLVYSLHELVYKKGLGWDELSIQSQPLATAHSEYIVCLYYNRKIETLPLNSPLRPILDILFKISALSFVTRDTGELYSLEKGASMNRNQVAGLEEAYIKYIKLARDQAVPLVDALGVPDEKLNSSLGKYDGNVYEDMMERVFQDPLNRVESGDKTRKRLYDNYISPIIHYKSSKI